MTPARLPDWSHRGLGRISISAGRSQRCRSRRLEWFQFQEIVAIDINRGRKILLTARRSIWCIRSRYKLAALTAKDTISWQATQRKYPTAVFAGQFDRQFWQSTFLSTASSNNECSAKASKPK